MSFTIVSNKKTVIEGLKKFLWDTEYELKRIDKVPKWIKFPLTDSSDFTFYVKGKNHRYKIKVYNYKTMSQKEKVWKGKRKR